MVGYIVNNLNGHHIVVTADHGLGEQLVARFPISDGLVWSL